jgi:hypothetical protein
VFFNGLQGLLAGNFPVIHATLGEGAWRALVRRFYAEHRCTTPLFTEIAKEFVDWLSSSPSSFLRKQESIGIDESVDSCFRRNDGERAAWLPELAHYEWVELALQIADADIPPHDPAGDVLTGVPVLSPLAWPLAYVWPVHRIGPDFQPDAPPDAPTLLLVRRDRTGDVHFSTLTPLAYRLLELIRANTNATGAALLQALAIEAGQPNDPTFLAAGTAMLARFRDESLLLGTRP